MDVTQWDLWAGGFCALSKWSILFIQTYVSNHTFYIQFTWHCVIQNECHYSSYEHAGLQEDRDYLIQDWNA